VHLVGYCLGGTMALAAAMHVKLLSLTLIAAPWHFSGYGDSARAEIGAMWRSAEPAAKRLGLVPMEVLQSGFWRLDPARTVAKFEAFGRLDPGSEQARAFVALEDWANGGAPLTYAAGRELFEDFVGTVSLRHGSTFLPWNSSPAMTASSRPPLRQTFPTATCSAPAMSA
jgi:polyhydroxyalkanoate synthase subunit PhaC